MSKSIVYVPQRPVIKNELGEWIPKWDLSQAEQFGILQSVVSPLTRPYNSFPVIAEIKAVLCNYTDQDYLIAIGNPAILSWCVALAAWYNYGRVKMLQWNGQKNDYVCVEANLGME